MTKAEPSSLFFTPNGVVFLTRTEILSAAVVCPSCRLSVTLACSVEMAEGINQSTNFFYRPDSK